MQPEPVAVYKYPEGWEELPEPKDNVGSRTDGQEPSPARDAGKPLRPDMGCEGRLSQGTGTERCPLPAAPHPSGSGAAPEHQPRPRDSPAVGHGVCTGHTELKPCTPKPAMGLWAPRGELAPSGHTSPSRERPGLSQRGC